MDKSGEIDFLDNPFKVQDGVIKETFKRIEGGDYELADIRSGEVSMFRKADRNKRVLVDTGNYVKLYKQGMRVALGLSNVGMMMFIYIASHLLPHADVVILECGSCCEFCNCKRSTYFSVLSELLDKKVIARKKGSSIEFFVNINYVFNGSRLKIKN